jgi:hypothetical protein
VLSLVERPAASATADSHKTLVVVHSLIQPAEAAAPSSAVAVTGAPSIVAAPVAAPAQAPVNAQASARSPGKTAPLAAPSTKVEAAAPAASASSTQSPAGVAALAEVPPAVEVAPVPAPTTDQAIIAPDEAAPQKNVASKPRPEDDALRDKQSAYPRRKTAGNQGLGSLLRHLFSAHGRNSYYPN